MNIPAHLLPQWLSICLTVVALLGLVVAGKKAKWQLLLADTGQHVFLGSLVIVAFFWELEINIRPGLALHLLGATLLTRMMGAGLAIFALTGVLIFHTLYHQQFHTAVALNQLVLVVFPVMFSAGLQQLLDRFLPKNLFVYLLGGGFIGAALSFSFSGLLAVGCMGLLGGYPFDYLLGEYLPYWLLLSWGEAFQTGLLLTLMVVYKPAWICSFDDRQYLGPKRSIWKDKP